jgi:GNAT superfamily N-acetyltransferase
MNASEFYIRPAAKEKLGGHCYAVWFHAVKMYDHLSLLGWSRLEVGTDNRVWFAVSVELPVRHGGIGRALLAAACSWADGHGIEIHLASKPNLVDWYQSAGFKKIEPEEGFKMARGQILMVRVPLTESTLHETIPSKEEDVP